MLCHYTNCVIILIIVKAKVREEKQSSFQGHFPLCR